MPFVIVDTNALMRDYLLIEANMQTFLRGCKRCHITVCVPEVVLDELCANYAKDIRRLATELHACSRRLMRMGIKAKADQFDIQDEVKKYRDHVRQIMAVYDVIFAPYPEVPPKALVEASYLGKKPFKESGDGFKDFLIFETIKIFAAQQGTEGSFVTGNRKDFCGSDGQLHPDLQAALSTRLVIFDAIHDFNSEVLSHDLEVLDDIAARIRKGQFTGFDLGDTLTSCFITELCDKFHQIDDVEPVEDATVYAVGGPKTRDLTVSRLDANQLLLELTGEIDLELSGFMPKSAVYAMSDEESDTIHVDDPDWNDWVASVSTTSDFAFSMTVIFDEAKKEIDSVSIELEPLHQA